MTEGTVPMFNGAEGDRQSCWMRPQLKPLRTPISDKFWWNSIGGGNLTIFLWILAWDSGAWTKQKQIVTDQRGGVWGGKPKGGEMKITLLWGVRQKKEVVVV